MACRYVPVTSPTTLTISRRTIQVNACVPGPVQCVNRASQRSDRAKMALLQHEFRPKYDQRNIQFQSGEIEFTKRFSNGVLFDVNYAHSRLLASRRRNESRRRPRLVVRLRSEQRAAERHPALELCLGAAGRPWPAFRNWNESNRRRGCRRLAAVRSGHMAERLTANASRQRAAGQSRAEPRRIAPIASDGQRSTTRHPQRWFDTAAYRLPTYIDAAAARPVRQFGTTGIGTVYGPRLFSFDMTRRSLPLDGKLRLGSGARHTISSITRCWATPTLEVTSATFGQIRASTPSYIPRGASNWECALSFELMGLASSPCPRRCRAASASAADLFRDDFSRFPPGWLTSPVGGLNGAIQEYHYLAHRGVPLGPWENPISHHDSWMMSDEDGKSYLEEQLDPTSPSGAAAVHHRRSRVERLHRGGRTSRSRSPKWPAWSSAITRIGTTICSRWRTATKPGWRCICRSKKSCVSRLAANSARLLSPTTPTVTTRSRWKTRVRGSAPTSTASCCSRPPIRRSQRQGRSHCQHAGAFPGFPRDRAGCAKRPRSRTRISAVRRSSLHLRAANPKPKLWKKFDTPSSARAATPFRRSGRRRRARHADRAEHSARPRRCVRPDQLPDRGQPRRQGALAEGRPDPRNGLLTNDTPFQIHDIDGDGRTKSCW